MSFSKLYLCNYSMHEENILWNKLFSNSKVENNQSYAITHYKYYIDDTHRTSSPNILLCFQSEIIDWFVNYDSIIEEYNLTDRYDFYLLAEKEIITMFKLAWL